MAHEGEDTVIYEECADDLSDVPIDIADWEEDVADSIKESEAESSDSEVFTRRIRRTLRLPRIRMNQKKMIVYRGQMPIYRGPMRNLKGFRVQTYFPKKHSASRTSSNYLLGWIYSNISAAKQTSIMIKIATEGK